MVETDDMLTIRIVSSEVLDDIRSAAWIESETHPECNLHQRHEMADICEKDNIERVWRVLGICVAEIRAALRSVLIPDRSVFWQNDLESPEEWIFSFGSQPAPHIANLVKEKIHEYLVARVMADRLSVLMPMSAVCWEEQGKDAFAMLSSIASTELPYSPARRPLWPL